MRILEFTSRSDKPSAQQLTALAEYLLGRADDEATQHTVPIKVFLSMAHNMGVNITDQQLRTLATQDPLKNIISNVDADEIILVGAGVTGEEGADTMTVDQAQDTVAGMADSALLMAMPCLVLLPYLVQHNQKKSKKVSHDGVNV